MKFTTITLFSVLMLVSGFSLAADNHYNHAHHEQHEERDDHEEGEHNESQKHIKHEDDHSQRTDDGGTHADHKHHNDHHNHDHQEHEEGRTEISPKSANAAGIHVSEVKPAHIKEVLPLTGRIILNRDTTAEVRARFPGIVKKVNVNWGESVKKDQVLAVIEANESLRTYQVKSPTRGIVLDRNTNVGNVTGEERIFIVADLSQVWAEFHVFPRDLSSVKLDHKVRVHTLENDQEQIAPIHLIQPTVDALSQTVVAIVAIDNHQKHWRPGMTVEGDVMVSEQEVAMAVSEEAIQRMEDQTVVFIKEGNTYELRPVTLGISDGSFIEVKTGLSVGEQYVSQGSFIVKADIGKSEAEHEH